MFHSCCLFAIDVQFPRVEGLSSRQYSVAVRLTLDQTLSSGALVNQQSARTCGTSSENSISSDLELVNWNEIFFFKVDSPVSVVFIDPLVSIFFFPRFFTMILIFLNE